MGEKMKVWILNHYAGPPASVPATRPHDLAKRLIARGHDTLLVSSSFDHYSFQYYQESSASIDSPSIHEGAKYVWIKTFSYTRNGLRRFFGMIQYFVTAVYLGVQTRHPPDIIVGTCVHPFAVTAALLLAKIHRAKFVYEITDLWPESLQELYGYKWWHPLVILFSLMQEIHLRSADLVIGLLPDINKYLQSKRLKELPFVWIPNGVDMSRFDGVSAYVGGNNEIVNIMYIGGFARAHNLTLLLDALDLVSVELRGKLRFHLVGDGPERVEFEQATKARFPNIFQFHGFVKKVDLFRYMNLADAFVCTSLPLNIYKYGAFFLKVFDYLAAGRPVLFGVDASNNPVSEAKAGLIFPSGDAAALARAIEDFCMLSFRERIEMGNRGRQYVKDNFDFDYLAEKLENSLKSILPP